MTLYERVKGQEVFRNECTLMPRCPCAPGEAGSDRGVGEDRGSVRQRRAVDPICHPLLTSKFQFPENSMPSSAFRKEDSVPVGLGIVAAERTGVRETPMGCVVGQRKAITNKGACNATVCSVTPHDMKAFLAARQNWNS